MSKKSFVDTHHFMCCHKYKSRTSIVVHTSNNSRPISNGIEKNFFTARRRVEIYFRRTNYMRFLSASINFIGPISVIQR